MIKTIFLLIYSAAVVTSAVEAQTITPEQYIALYKDIAIREMKRMGVPAAISLAQGILETESGNSDLVKKSNNHFGIKCKSSWTAAGVKHDDDAPGECFRTYKNAEESYRDHSNFLRGGERYSFLFELNPTDYKAWAYGLRKAGYATNPNYPNILIRHIEQYNLQQYSLAGAHGVPKFETGKYKDDPVVYDKNQTIQSEPQLESDPMVADLNQNKNSETNTPASDAIDKINLINGSKCINAKKGMSLLVIATRYNISLRKLLDINELVEDGILDIDQPIFLQKKSKTGEKDFVIVQKKETLYDVAQENGILLESLMEYNQLDDDKEVLPGTKIFLKEISGTVSPKTVQDKKAINTKAIMHEVQPKEGLYTVAKKYSITVQQLREWNNLTSDELRVGQQLIVGK